MEKLKIDKPIRLIELFSGIGAQAKALERLGVNFEHYRTSEWEWNAVASYKAIHKENDSTDYSAEFTKDELTEILFGLGISSDGKKPMTKTEIARKNEDWHRTVFNNFKATNNIGSIVNVDAEDLGIVDTDKYTYICCYSFPCTDLSLAGKQKGMAKGSNTSSSMLWEVERLLNECTELPQILLMENVTQVHGTKNKEHFDEWLAFLESKGYKNYWKDLNAKNFGIPQNRNRCFMVSVLGGYSYEFPEEFPLALRLKDMLEDSVDEKFYISNEKINKIANSTFAQEKTMIQKTDVCGTLLARDYKDPKCVEVEPVRLGGLYDTETSRHQAGAIWDKGAVAPTVDTMQGENRQPMIVEDFYKNRGERVYGDVAPTLRSERTGLKVAEPIIDVIGNYSPSGHDASRIVDSKGIAPTVKENHGTVTAVAEPLAYDEQNGYIRKDGTVGTLTTDGSSPKHNNRVIIPANNKKGYDEAVEGDTINLEQPGSKTRRGRVGHGVAQTLNTATSQVVVENCYVSEKGVRFICSPKRGMTTDVNADVCQPLTAKGQANWTGSFVSPDIESLEKSSTIGSTEPTKINLNDGSQITSNDNLSGIRIRKLTPKECWRLMGFDDADFDKAAQYNSNTQLYKQAGNSIVVDVLCYIFKQML